MKKLAPHAVVVRPSRLSFLFCALYALGGPGFREEGYAQRAGVDLPRDANRVDAAALAQRVIIHRDEYGVPHIVGDDDEATFFGFGYAQAEDNFWQVEDAYILSLGRYSEVHGPKGLNSDLLNRAFEIVPRSRRDFDALDPTSRRMCAAFVAGINFYVERHPEERPRLVAPFEPWHVLAYHRHVALELAFRFTGLGNDYLPRRNPQIDGAIGSNGWAVRGRRTDDDGSMLLAMPHMPWFGFTQLYEAHLASGGEKPDEGGDAPGAGPPWNFTGAGFLGSPALALGHNDKLGWTLVSNQPDIADLWRERFDKPDDPLAYAYGGGYRRADEWTETIRIRKSQSFDDRKFTFRKTHHGPIVKREGEQAMLAARISGLFEAVPLRQWLRMARSANLDEFRTAIASMQILYMNVLYADRDNIWFLYNGSIPRRNPKFDWSQPVDGGDPATEWLGVYELDELPQILNPPSDFLQNCNSTPLEAAGRLDAKSRAAWPADLPRSLVGDAEVRSRRSLRAIELLEAAERLDFPRWQTMAFDGEVFWAKRNLPRYASALKQLNAERDPLADSVRPYLEHLLDWDGCIAPDSTAAALCQAWYELMYGAGYPGESIRPQFRGDRRSQLAALVRAAEGLTTLHGTWKLPYGQLFRVQRQPQAADLVDVRFDDNAASLPSLGGHGPMGVVFTTYYSPTIEVPLVISQRKRYGMVGPAYTAAWKFTPQGVQGASLSPLGASGRAASPHFFDQAPLYSEMRLKPEHFTPEEVAAAAVRSYRPGEEQTRRGRIQASGDNRSGAFRERRRGN